ncbi:MAG: hypothetical protein IT580_19550 [Verrucomicrobiales bacterium]|nr:hypothetical protein [Verrucomicrobiales bacterium]
MRHILEQMGPLLGGIEPSAVQGLEPGFPLLPEVDIASGAMALGPFPEEIKALGRLRDGCYRLWFVPDSTHGNLVTWPALLGTLRLESLSPMHWVASGDFYRSDGFFRAQLDANGAGLGPLIAGQEDATRTIPSFPRDQYHAYFRVRQVRIAAKAGGGDLETRGVTLDVEVTRLLNREFGIWDPPEPVMFRFRAVKGMEPEPGGHARGAVFGVRLASGPELGELHMEWVSPYFREAVVELDAEATLRVPEDNGSTENWATVFARAGWLVRSETGMLVAPTPASGRWTLRELHQAMLRSRREADLDSGWRYHVTVVRHFADTVAPLGIAFDHGSADLNEVPREGVALNAGARLPTDAVYGPYGGRRLHECPDLYFNVAVHEIGHAMGLHHNHVGYGLMEQVSGLAARASGGRLTSGAMAPEFAPDDLFRLRHLPDVHVRPGGTPWDTTASVEDHAHAMPRPGVSSPRGWVPIPRERGEVSGPLSLTISRMRLNLPLGAPLRVDFTLLNPGSRTLEVPAQLSLATPFVHGWVVGPDGGENEFRSLFKPINAAPPVRLAPGGWQGGSLTLLRGRRGALLARPGWHTLWLEVSWLDGGERRCVRARARFEVLPPQAAAEERLARRIRSTPETLGYLVFGSTPSYRAGERVVREALESPVYASHFAYVHAKALGERDPSAGLDWRSVSELLAPESNRSVLNLRELDKAAALQRLAFQNIHPPPPVSPP